MALKPFSDSGNRAFIGIRRWVRAMKHPDFTEQKYTNARTLSFTHLSAQTNKQRFNLRPAD
ncbi:hypothetical protein FHW17_001653 [Phyllobacterium sp. P30BS-XVII]|nr:hypothetical protein [Phyllobacterium sp. P30BS-XVII]